MNPLNLKTFARTIAGPGVAGVRLGRLVFIGGLCLWGWMALDLLPSSRVHLRYLFCLEWGVWQTSDWVHPLFVPLLGALRFALGTIGYSGRMLMPLQLMNLVLGGLTLVGLFLLAERWGRDSLTAAVGVLCLGFFPRFWQQTLRADPYAMSGAFSILTMALLIGGRPRGAGSRYFLAGVAAGLTAGFHASGLSLLPVAVLAAWSESASARERGRRFSLFAGGMVLTVVLGYAVFIGYSGIDFDLGALRFSSIQKAYFEQEGVPKSTIFSSKDIAKQLRDTLATFGGAGGIAIPLLLGLGLSFAAHFIARRKSTLSAAQRRAAGLALATMLSYFFFFLINDSSSVFVYVAVLSAPLLLSVLVVGRPLLRMLLLMGMITASFFGRVGILGSDPIDESRFLNASLGSSDIVILPHCPFVGMFHERRFNVLSLVDHGCPLNGYSLPAARSEMFIDRIFDSLERGRRVFLSVGNPSQTVRSGWSEDGEPESSLPRIRAVKGRLEESFLLDRRLRSPAGMEYFQLGLKPGVTPEGKRPEGLSYLGREDFKALSEVLAENALSPTGRIKMRYLMEWLEESPEDVWVRYDLIALNFEQAWASRRRIFGDAQRSLLVADVFAREGYGGADFLADYSRHLLEAGRNDEALKVLQKAAGLPPGDTGLRRMADLYRDAKDFERALMVIDSLARRHPGDASLEVERAGLGIELGRRDQALKALRRAEGLSPGDTDLRRMADLYRAAKDLDRALKVVDSLARRRPGDASLEVERAGLGIDLGRRDQALKALRRAEGLSPGDADLRRMADLYRVLNDFERALKAVDALARRLPGDASLEVERAELSLELGRRAEALEALKRAESLGLSTDDQRRAARGYQLLGDCPRALRLWKRILRGTRPLAKDYSDKAVCEYLSGNWEASRSDLQKAIGLSPGALEAHLSLGMVYEGRGFHDKALKVYERALAAEPVKGMGNVRRRIIDARDDLRRKLGKNRTGF